jgi:membrane protein
VSGLKNAFRRILRAYKYYGERKGDFLAGGVTFFGFLSLFPLIVLASSLVVALLGPERVDTLKETIQAQIPGISEQINPVIDRIADNWGTVGVIGALTLLLGGLGVINAMRQALRSMWNLEEEKGNFLVKKTTDLGALAGLGAMGVVALATGALATFVLRIIAEPIGLADNPIGLVILQVLLFAVTIVVDAILFAYVLGPMPRIHMPRKVLLQGALIGAVGFEIMKQLLTGVIVGTATNPIYASFGIPLALLVWINFVNRLTMFCSAWTATASEVVAEREAQAAAVGKQLMVAPRPVAGTGANVPTQRAALAAGLTLGVLISAAAGALSGAVRQLAGTSRSGGDETG